LPRSPNQSRRRGSAALPKIKKRLAGNRGAFLFVQKVTQPQTSVRAGLILFSGGRTLIDFSRNKDDDVHGKFNLSELYEFQ
jgi:hypothetical protein